MNGDDLLEELIQWADARQLRLDNPYVLDLVRILYPHERGLPRRQVINTIWQKRCTKGLNMPDAFDEAVQSSFQAYAGEYATFKRQKRSVSEDLFFAPRGKGAGWWAVRRDKAQAWLESKKKELQA